MKYVVNAVNDLELILVEQLRNHIFNEVRVGEIFEQFPNMRISSVHPFAYLLDQQINSVSLPADLFPSVTITDDSDTKDHQADMATLEEDNEVVAADVATIAIDDKAVKYIIAPVALAKLRELTATGKAYATGATQRRRTSIVVEVWAQNQIVKNRIYDIVRNWFIGFGRFKLYQELEILIDEASISGQKSGNYNFDFGYMLHGSVLRFEVVHVLEQYVVDTEIVPLADIVHTAEEVHDEE